MWKEHFDGQFHVIVIRLPLSMLFFLSLMQENVWCRIHLKRDRMIRIMESKLARILCISSMDIQSQRAHAKTCPNYVGWEFKWNKQNTLFQVWHEGRTILSVAYLSKEEEVDTNAMQWKGFNFLALACIKNLKLESKVIVRWARNKYNHEIARLLVASEFLLVWLGFYLFKFILKFF